MQKKRGEKNDSEHIMPVPPTNPAPPAAQTSWNEVASWYDQLVKQKDSYQQKVLLPNLTRVVGDVLNDYDALQKLNVVDVGCGNGIFSFSLAKQYPQLYITGIDAGPKLIDAALYSKNHKATDINIKNRLNFMVNDAAHTTIGNDTQDIVICVLALQNMKDGRAVVQEMSRMTRRGARVLLILNHPYYRMPKGSSWGFIDVKDKPELNGGFRRIDRYMSEYAVTITMNPGKAHSASTTSFHRPLQWYTKHFAAEGFALTRLEEWLSHKKSEPGPRQQQEDRLRKEIPMFMCLEFKKF